MFAVNLITECDKYDLSTRLVNNGNIDALLVLYKFDTIENIISNYVGDLYGLMAQHMRDIESYQYVSYYYEIAEKNKCGPIILHSLAWWHKIVTKK